MDLKSTPITAVVFNLPIFPNQLRYFRGAVIERVMTLKHVFEAAGILTDLFHNHTEQIAITSEIEQDLPDGRDTQFRYPLIQYKIRHQNASIIGIGEGAQALQLWLSLAGDQLILQGRAIPLEIHYHHHSGWSPKLGSKTVFYRLNKWLPFNAQKFQEWKSREKLSDRVDLLDKLLWGHLFYFLEGVEVMVDRKSLNIYLSTIDMMSFKDSYGIKRLALDVTFGTNLLLPEEIGLGQGVSIGYGKVQKISVRKKSKSNPKLRI